MKKTITKKLFTFILFIGGMFSFTVANAQCVCYCSNGQPRKFAECYLRPDGTEGCISTKHRPCRMAEATSTPGATSVEDIYPNPVSASATIAYYVEQTQNVSLKIYDVSGRLVITLADASFEEGRYENIWNADDVKSGIYFLRMETASYSENWKLIVAK